MKLIIDILSRTLARVFALVFSFCIFKTALVIIMELITYVDSMRRL